MKKIIALVVAILMIASMSVVAFAERDPAQVANETITRVQADETDGEAIGNGTELTYTVSQGYVVTIPADTAFVDLKAQGTIALDDVKVPGDKQVQVQIASDWKLEDTADASDDVDYGAYLSAVDAYTTTNKLASGAVVIDANMYDDIGDDKLDGAEATATIYFATVGTSQVGIYLDTITFTSYVVDYDAE